MSKEIVYKKDVLDLLSTMPPEEGITRALLIQSVKQLPSAQPVARDTNVLNSDYISRQAAKKAVEDYLLSIDISKDYPSITGAIKRVITDLPSAQPETEERTAESAQNVQNGELISKKAALDALKRAEALTRAFGYHYVIDTIQELPSAQPERIRGKWEYVDYGGFGNYHCTACRSICICNGDYDFCPNCGADMRGEQDETD